MTWRLEVGKLEREEEKDGEVVGLFKGEIREGERGSEVVVERRCISNEKEEASKERAREERGKRLAGLLERNGREGRDCLHNCANISAGLVGSSMPFLLTLPLCPWAEEKEERLEE